MAWLTVPNGDSDKLSAAIDAAVQRRIASGEFSAQDVKNISERELALIPKDLAVPPHLLEKLRRLCQLWEVDIRDANITSHRKVIGPFIVAAKKMIYPLIRFALKDLIREQRDFNAEVISTIAELANAAHKKS